MPQGRRREAFSGKQKKAQLAQKKIRKADHGEEDEGPRRHHHHRHPREEGAVVGSRKEDGRRLLVDEVQLGGGRAGGGGRYDLKFRVESKEELAALRESARKTLEHIASKRLQASTEMFFPDDLTFPQRPTWDHLMDKNAVEASEAKYFRQFVGDMLAKHENVSYFELNLETWRQLWRVVEMSDVLLVIVDCRFPAAMFPPSLYYFVQSLGKNMILVLNKVDLVPAGLAAAWKDYFVKKFPGLRVTFFSSCPTYNLRTSLTIDGQAGLKHRRMRGRISMVVEGAKQVLAACREIVAGVNASVDLDAWQALVERAAERLDGAEGAQTTSDVLKVDETKDDTPFTYMERFAGNVLTLGTIGQPNSGKSSLINSIMGKKVVSVSKTPGHTKHFQTIFVTKSVKLCDCPGLVFPSLVPKQLQILMGSFPIAQLREPISAVKFLAERADLVDIMKLTHPDGTTEWSAFDVCEAWAVKRGYVTAKSNRPDVHRAANHILRMALEGKITLHLYPEAYANSQLAWEDHTWAKEVIHLLALDEAEVHHVQEEQALDGSEDDDETDGESTDNDQEVDEEDSEDEQLGAHTVNKFVALEGLDEDD